MSSKQTSQQNWAFKHLELFHFSSTSIKISIQFGVSSLQLPVEYNQLPPHLIASPSCKVYHCHMLYNTVHKLYNTASSTIYRSIPQTLYVVFIYTFRASPWQYYKGWDSQVTVCFMDVGPAYFLPLGHP